MSRRGGIAGLLVLAAALASTALSSPAIAAPRPPLDHEGRWITDAHGRVVTLHGFNMVNKLGSYRPEDTGFGKDDVRFLRRHGFNTVRLGIIYNGLEPRPPRANGKPRYRRGYLRSIARTERALARGKIFTLLDFHQDLFNERFEGEGWPDWQTLDDGLPAEPKSGFPGNYLAIEALQRAFDHFWANDPAAGVPLQKAYARAWRLVARRFRDRPYVAGYDLLNEPWPGSAYPACLGPGGCPAFDSGPLTAFSNRVIDAIRTVDRATLAFYEANVLFDFGADTSHGDTGDRRAGLSYHPYCLEGGGGLGGATSCAGSHAVVFENADGHSERTGDALLVTEFGATDDLAEIRRVIDLADEHMVGWQYWHYCDCDDPTTTGPGVQGVITDPSRRPRRANLDRQKLRLLARPFPQAVAGTPRRISFDPDTRELELVYSTRTPRGDVLPRRRATEVRVPRINFRDGYRARADGATVTSKRDAGVVRLKRDRGASEVTVAIAPR